MDGNAARLALRLYQQQGLVAEDKSGRAVEKVRGDDRRVGGDRACALDEGDGFVAGLRHGASPDGKRWRPTRSMSACRGARHECGRQRDAWWAERR